jgi:hypothetical protein
MLDHPLQCCQGICCHCLCRHAAARHPHTHTRA